MVCCLLSITNASFFQKKKVLLMLSENEIAHEVTLQVEMATMYLLARENK